MLYVELACESLMYVYKPGFELKKLKAELKHAKNEIRELKLREMQ